MSNIVIEYRISLSSIKFRISHLFRVDADIFEKTPRVDADFFYGYIRCVFKTSINGWTWPKRLLLCGVW